VEATEGVVSSRAGGGGVPVSRTWPSTRPRPTGAAGAWAAGGVEPESEEGRQAGRSAPSKRALLKRRRVRTQPV
jgi:hypothetical protein